ncbi:hypothetical protein EVAR_50203_1 [Eumeta japonica]|uniref:Uncharacterized protein n=1 Tax=Eumeta variegata TaxID=151549 RepID=A0A4C1X0C5_EUMVA|nr:hypothetical protein EVAR_50203_1 [Eumeta japonica]
MVRAYLKSFPLSYLIIVSFSCADKTLISHNGPVLVSLPILYPRSSRFDTGPMVEQLQPSIRRIAKQRRGSQSAGGRAGPELAGGGGVRPIDDDDDELSTHWRNCLRSYVTTALCRFASDVGGLGKVVPKVGGAGCEVSHSLNLERFYIAFDRAEILPPSKPIGHWKRGKRETILSKNARIAADRRELAPPKTTIWFLRIGDTASSWTEVAPPRVSPRARPPRAGPSAGREPVSIIRRRRKEKNTATDPQPNYLGGTYWAVIYFTFLSPGHRSGARGRRWSGRGCEYNGGRGSERGGGVARPAPRAGDGVTAKVGHAASPRAPRQSITRSPRLARRLNGRAHTRIRVTILF